MGVDVSRFHLQNVADTCAVWNVLSSMTLLRAARRARVTFCCTDFVIYECLVKPRKSDLDCERELRSRLSAARGQAGFQSYHLDIEDLQTVDILEKRKRLGKGELASIAFAKKTRQAFITDDQNARKLASEALGSSAVQTTPHLFGWLFFTDHLADSDKDIIINEHAMIGRPLSKFLNEMYTEACRCRLMTRQTAQNASVLD